MKEDKNKSITRINEIKDPEERRKIYQEARKGKSTGIKQIDKMSKNLIPLNERPIEEQKAIRRKAAEATNRIKGEKKTAKQILDNLLPLFVNTTAITENDTIPVDIKAEILKKKIDITQYDLIMLSQIYQAQQGNTKAAEFIANHNGDIVSKDINIHDSMSEADRELINKLSKRMGLPEIIDV